MSEFGWYCFGAMTMAGLPFGLYVCVKLARLGWLRANELKNDPTHEGE